MDREVNSRPDSITGWIDKGGYRKEKVSQGGILREEGPTGGLVGQVQIRGWWKPHSSAHKPRALLWSCLPSWSHSPCSQARNSALHHHKRPSHAMLPCASGPLHMMYTSFGNAFPPLFLNFSSFFKKPKATPC